MILIVDTIRTTRPVNHLKKVVIMQKCIYLLFPLLIFSSITNAEEASVQSYGHYKKMIHMKTTDGVIGFYSASSQDAYTHPGESWHLHTIWPRRSQLARHLNRFG